MPIAERDLPVAQWRTRFPGFNDSVCGVRYERGEALDPMSDRALARARAIGLGIEVVGPWVEESREQKPAPAEAPPPPVVTVPVDPPPVYAPPAPVYARPVVQPQLPPRRR